MLRTSLLDSSSDARPPAVVDHSVPSSSMYLNTKEWPLLRLDNYQTRTQPSLFKQMRRDQLPPKMKKVARDGMPSPAAAISIAHLSGFANSIDHEAASIDHKADGYHSDTLTILDDINLPALAQPSLGCTQARPECDVLISHAVGKQVLEYEVRSDSTPRARVRQERCLWKEHLGARSNACRASEEVVLTWLHVVRRRCHLAVSRRAVQTVSLHRRCTRLCAFCAAFGSRIRRVEVQKRVANQESGNGSDSKRMATFDIIMWNTRPCSLH